MSPLSKKSLKRMKRKPDDFCEQLGVLVTAELGMAFDDYDRVTRMMDQLIIALAMAIRVAGGGNQEFAGKVMEQAISYLTRDVTRPEVAQPIDVLMRMAKAG